MKTDCCSGIVARLPGRVRWWLVLKVEMAILVAACRMEPEGALTYVFISIAGPSHKHKPVWQTDSSCSGGSVYAETMTLKLGRVDTRCCKKGT